MAIETQGSSEAAATFNIPVGHRVSWGAIVAGVSLLFALSWLLLLLGSAIGVGIADATDLSAIGDGLGLGSIIWILLSAIVATFAGGLLAAKMSGTPNDRIGALHGLTVWSVGMILTIVLGASGIGGAVNAISGAVGSANNMTTKVITVASGAEADSTMPNSITTGIAAVIKRQASKVLSNVGTDATSPNRNEVRSAIESLNAEDAGAITSALIAGDTEKARNVLTQQTNLSDSDINAIIEGAEQKAESWSESDDLEQAQEWLNAQINDIQRSVSRSVSEIAGAQVSSQEVNKALQELDSKTMMQAGQYLVMGQPEMAKDVLAVNTNLSETDIEAIVDGVEKETQQLVNKAKKELNEASETAGTFAQAVLWSAFIAAALGMVAGVVGGHLGAGAVRRVYAVR